MAKYMDSKDNRRFQSAHRTPGSAMPEPRSRAEHAEGLDPERPSDGAPQGSDRAQSGRRTSAGSARDTKRSNELMDLMSSGNPKQPNAAQSHGAFGADVYCEPLNARPGERMGSLSEEADAALRQMGGLRRTTINSSISEHTKVTIPSEGGPDSQREM